MAKVSKEEIELHPDGWQRFERAMGAVVKAPPQHRVKAKTKKKGRLTATMKRRGLKKPPG